MTAYPSDPPTAIGVPREISQLTPEAPWQERAADLWTVDVLSTSVSISGLSDAEIADLDRCWQRCNPRRGGKSVAVVARRTGISWRQQQEDIVSMLTLAGINTAAGSRLMFHAGGISDSTGRALALVAKSGTGKTTAVRNLAQRFSYLSDETIAIDPESLSIAPYPKPLSVLGPDGKRPKQQHSPEELGLLETPPGAILHKIAVLDRQPGCASVQQRHLDISEALQLLVPDSSSLSRLERGLVTLVNVLERTGGAVRITYGENTQLTALVPELLGEDHPASEPRKGWAPADLTVREDSKPNDGIRRVRRIVPDDALWLEDSLAILNAERLDFVSGIGAVIWDTARTWLSHEELHRVVVAAHGAHPKSTTLVADAIQSLSAARLVESTSD